MPQQFHFADAFWFRVPLKALVLVVAVFGLLSIYPAFTHGSPSDHERAIFGAAMMLMFIALAATFAVAIDDGYVEINERTLSVRFEAFFNMEIPLEHIASATRIDPRPRWRYRFGLSTDFRERVSCSHGGEIVELELRIPQRTRLWPRTVSVRRVWLAVRDSDRFLAELHRKTSGAPHALTLQLRAAA